MKILRMTVSCAAMATALVCTTVLPALAQEAACAPVDAVETAPPPLPTYDQPPVPGPGYLWSPGNWSWDEERADYYWVPGTWVEPPHEPVQTSEQRRAGCWRNGAARRTEGTGRGQRAAGGWRTGETGACAGGAVSRTPGPGQGDSYT